MSNNSNSGGNTESGQGQGQSTPTTSVPEVSRPVTTFVRDLPPGTIQKKD